MRSLQGLLLPLDTAALALFGALGCARHPAEDARTLVVWEQEGAAVAPFLDYLFEEFRCSPGR